MQVTDEDGKHLFYDIVKIKRDGNAFTEELSAPTATISNKSITNSPKNVNGKDKKIFGTAKNSSNQRFALSEEISGEKIKANMSDEERYEILKNRNIVISAKTDQAQLESTMQKLNMTEKDIDFSKLADKKRLFKKLGDEFGVFRKYDNSDIKLSFSFSKGGMGESADKQRSGFMRLAKLLTCMEQVIDNAVGIEVHNRNQEGYKVDDSLKNMYVLASAFVDGENIVPVKLEVKEFSDKENTLYVAIALESIKMNEIVKQEVAKNGVARQYSPSFTISIADFLKKINPSDESFYKQDLLLRVKILCDRGERGRARTKAQKVKTSTNFRPRRFW